MSGGKVLLSAVKFRGMEAKAADVLARAGHQLIDYRIEGRASTETLMRYAGEVAALIAGPEAVTSEVFERAPLLRVVSVPGVGFDHVDLAAAAARGVAVCNCPGCNHHAVAEMALAMMLALARRLPAANAAMQAGQWQGVRGAFQLWGKTLGVVGLGAIGRTLTRYAQALGMSVLAADSRRDIDFAVQHGISYVDLGTLLARSDVVSLHCPLTPATSGIINEKSLSQMKPTALLINTARGGLIDEPALAAALKERRIAGAGLDVFAEEPLRSNPFAGLDNVVMTPHSAGATQEAVVASFDVALQNVITVLDGWPPINVVRP